VRIIDLLLLVALEAKLLRQEFRQCRSRLPSLLTNSYFVATVGGAPLKIVKQYIENQKNA
jgi:putative transposase